MGKLAKFVRRVIRIEPAPIKAGETKPEERPKNVSDSLRLALKNPDPLTRMVAVELASRFLDKSLIPQLLELLHDPLHIVRQKAVLALGQLGDRSVVNALVEKLNDESEEVRVTVAGVLGHLRDRQAVPALILALQDKSAQTRMKAAISLGIIRDSRAVEPLRRVVFDPNEVVGKYAIEALGNIGRPAVGVLLELMNNERWRQLALDALMKIK